MEAKFIAHEFQNNKIRSLFVDLFVIDACRRKGKIILDWTNNINVQIKSYSMSHIAAAVEENNSKLQWEFVDFDGDPITRFRHRSWRPLNQLIVNGTDAILVMGDFNKFISPIEKPGGVSHPSKQIIDFNKAITLCGLHDLGF